MGFQTTDAKLNKALCALAQYVPLYGLQEIDLTDIHVEYTDSGALSWRKDGSGLFLICADEGQALMLLGRALTLRDRSSEKLTARFDRLGAMLDVSRNSVYTMSTMKKFLCQLALMGYTDCYLYMEDTYELPGYPYFGYRRGRYSVAEQKELDDFAATVGIELIPCIQTLAHLRTAIRWKYMQPMRDTIDNLMVGEKETVELVEAMISHFSKTFRSRRIHLGMDEAVGLGTGRYRLYKGYRDHRDIIMEHLRLTCDLCDKYGLKPLIWDDMLFRDHTPLMNYYGDSEPVTQQQRKEYPENLCFVYWDYYHDTEEEYEKQIRRRGCLDMAFAGGVWKWGGWVPNFTKSFQDSIAAVEACCKTGVKDIMVTLWGDDGDETPLATVVPGLALFGLLRFGTAFASQTDAMCLLLSGTPLKTYEAMEWMDLIPDMPQVNLEALVPHKLLLYGDIASELFMNSITDNVPRLAQHYQHAANYYEKAAEEIPDEHLRAIMKMYAALANVIACRCSAAKALHEGWSHKDMALLDQAKELLSELERRADALHREAVLVWSRECKGQGMEIIDLRLGGLAARARAVRERLDLYRSGVLDTLTELDEQELPYQGSLALDGRTPGRESYGEIVTANTLCHQFSI